MRTPWRLRVVGAFASMALVASSAAAAPTPSGRLLVEVSLDYSRHAHDERSFDAAFIVDPRTGGLKRVTPWYEGSLFGVALARAGTRIGRFGPWPLACAST